MNGMEESSFFLQVIGVRGSLQRLIYCLNPNIPFPPLFWRRNRW